MKKFLCALASVSAVFLTSCAAPDFQNGADERLFRTIQNGGTVETAAQAVSDGADIDAMPRGRFISVNMVEYASANGRDDIALALLDMGADVNYKSQILGKTLLMYFAEQCNYKLCAELIARGADASARDRVYDTALEYAFRAGAEHTEYEISEIVTLLLLNGAGVTRATLSAALAGYSGGGGADGRYALLKFVTETLRSQGETVNLPEELEAAIAPELSPENALAAETVFSPDTNICKECGCNISDGCESAVSQSR